MKLWAIADIHLSFKSNKEEWKKLKPRGPDDGLILAGDGTSQILTIDIRLCSG
jgi:predicted phosphodiesterase